jgi:hypothetical protein
MTSKEPTSKTDSFEKHADDDEDEDYNPDEDMQEDDDDELQNEADTTSFAIPSSRLSESKRKAVDQAFEQLFGYKFGTRFVLKRHRQGDMNGRREKILLSIFGPTAAAQILSTSDSVTKIRVRRAPLPTDTITFIAEVKRYAGQTITVKRKLDNDVVVPESSDAPDDVTNVVQEKPKGLDFLLQELNGPGKLSTVAKTSADWESFKAETGVEDELEKQAQGKNAFLQKQDFLQRVDHRRFEQEKVQRDQERSKRGK